MLPRLLLLLTLIVGCAQPAAEPPPVAPSPTATPEPTPVPLPPVVADLHVDTITMMMREEVGWLDGRLEASLPKLDAAGVNVVVQAAWVERGVEDPRGRAIGKLKRIRSMVQQSRKRAAIVTGPEQLEAVLREGRIAVVLMLEGGTGLSDVASLDELRTLGLSVLGMTWSESSPHADSSAEPRSPGGLTDSGRALLGAANDRGMIIDVSHMSDAATREAVELSRAPILASHSNAQALCDVPRNLNDELLALIAGRGGLVGAMFHGPYVVAGRPASRADVVGMVKGLTERIGAEHVGIGSDFDGIITAPTGLAGAEDLPALYGEIDAALGAEAGARVRGSNFLRLWKDVWAARRP